MSRLAGWGAGLGTALLLSACGAGAHMAPSRPRRVSARPRPLRVVVAQTGTLPAPVQDAAAAAISSQSFLLMGGIGQGEASVADILRVSASGAVRLGDLPVALHDASASLLGDSAYLFGGGVVQSFSAIYRIVPSGAVSLAGSLPTPGSDVASVAVGGTVYVVGGYTGQTPLRTILAWRPGESARTVARLPKPLRYAGVAAVGGQVLIAGGTSGEAASRDIYRFDPTTRRLARIGLLPSPLTHTAAASVGARAYVFGGRSAAADGQTRRILEIQPNGSVREVGLLPRALSDMAAVALGEKVVLAGGRDSRGRMQDAILTASFGRE